MQAKMHLFGLRVPTQVPTSLHLLRQATVALDLTGKHQNTVNDNG